MWFCFVVDRINLSDELESSEEAVLKVSNVLYLTGCL